MKYCKKHQHHFHGVRCPECHTIPPPPVVVEPKDTPLDKRLDEIVASASPDST